jgi:hypothetical protein
MCNCLIKFLLTVVFSIEEHVFLVEYFFREGNWYTYLVQEQFAEKSAVCRARPLTLNEVKTAITTYIRNISKADLQKVFANKIKRVQACIDVRGHTSNIFYKYTATFQTHCISLDISYPIDLIFSYLRLKNERLNLYCINNC